MNMMEIMTRIGPYLTWVGKALILLVIAVNAAYLISHFPFDRVEYIYQRY